MLARYRPVIGAVGAVALLVGSVSCGNVQQQGRAPVTVVVDLVEAASGADPGEMSGFLLSDVETVVHGYEEYGDEIVRRLRGMFALALWDERRERLLLARDRLGKKPLVYRAAGGRLSFASEFQALLCDPALPRRPDRAETGHDRRHGRLGIPP